MEQEYIIIIMEIYIVENGKMELKRGKEFFIGTKKTGKEIDMKGGGKMVNEMEKVYIIQPMVINKWDVI